MLIHMTVVYTCTSGRSKILKEVQEEDDDRMLARASSQMNFILGA